MTTATLRESRFARLAAWSYRHRGRALAAWVAVLIGVTALSSAVGSDYHNDFSLPGTESQAAIDTLEARAPAQAGDTIQIVVQDAGGLRTPAARDQVQAMLADVGGLPHVATVQSRSGAQQSSPRSSPPSRARTRTRAR